MVAQRGSPPARERCSIQSVVIIDLGIVASRYGIEECGGEQRKEKLHFGFRKGGEIISDASVASRFAFKLLYDRIVSSEIAKTLTYSNLAWTGDFFQICRVIQSNHDRSLE